VKRPLVLACSLGLVGVVLAVTGALFKPAPTRAASLEPPGEAPRDLDDPLDEKLTGVTEESLRTLVPAPPAPLVLPTPEELVEGTPAWDRYMVWDADYYARADAARIYISRPLRGGEAREPLARSSPRQGFGRPNQPLPEPLRVKVAPGVPVTFFAPDKGTFPNGQETITVKADSRGLATTTFTFWQSASYYRVVAASPLSEGWVVFDLEALNDAAWNDHVAQLNPK